MLPYVMHLYFGVLKDIIVYNNVACNEFGVLKSMFLTQSHYWRVFKMKANRHLVVGVCVDSRCRFNTAIITTYSLLCNLIRMLRTFTVTATVGILQLRNKRNRLTLSYRVLVRERYGSTLLPATREQHDQNCTQSH